MLFKVVWLSCISAVNIEWYTRTHNLFLALCILSGTTWVSWYQNIHLPTHTYPDHQSSFICFLHLLRSMASSLFNLLAWQSLCTTSVQVFFGLPLVLAPSTSYSIHFCTKPLYVNNSTSTYWQHICAAGTIRTEPQGLSWCQPRHVYPRHCYCQSLLCSTLADQECTTFTVQRCPAGAAPCTCRQQGRLLQHCAGWSLWIIPAASPVSHECRYSAGILG